MKRLSTIVAALALASAVSSSANAAINESSLHFTAQIRDGVNVKIVAAVLENPANVSGTTVLCLHGLGHTGDSFRLLATNLLTSGVRRTILLNLPDRGGSGDPFGTNPPLFGDLTLQDYAHVLTNALKICQEQGIPASALVAHSMGGIITQVAQEELLNAGTKLASFGVQKAILLSSSPPREVPNPLFDLGTGLVLASLYVDDSNPDKGTVINIPVGDYPGLFFSYPLFVPALDAPSPARLTALNVPNIEALAASIQTAGLATDRPSVRAGAFAPANGTALRVVWGLEDSFSPPGVQQNLYVYLTGDGTLSNFDTIPIGLLPATFPVHDEYISEPAIVAAHLGL